MLSRFSKLFFPIIFLFSHGLAIAETPFDQTVKDGTKLMFGVFAIRANPDQPDTPELRKAILKIEDSNGKSILKQEYFKGTQLPQVFVELCKEHQKSIGSA